MIELATKIVLTATVLAVPIIVLLAFVTDVDDIPEPLQRVLGSILLAIGVVALVGVLAIVLSFIWAWDA